MIPPFRSHATNLRGQPYTTTGDHPYRGSVCDTCEENGVTFFHHPLRCNRDNNGWNKPDKAPELNGITTWHKRGGGVCKLGDTSA